MKQGIQDAPLKRSFESGFILYLWYGTIRENNETSTSTFT